MTTTTEFKTPFDSMNDDALWRFAEKCIPLGTQTMSKMPRSFITGVYPKFVACGKGANLYTRSGEKYLDYMCALGPIILGYNDKKTNKAIRRQLKNGIIFSLPTQLESEVAELIIQTVPCAERVRFAKNGTDATLAAVRIARSYTGREHVIKCGYHGWSDWHGVLIRPFGIPNHMKDIISEFTYNDLNSLEDELRKRDCACVIMEAQALEEPQHGFLEGVRELTTKYGALLIFDEVVTGYRWSLGGAQKHFGVTPDLATLGKAIANGMPLSAIVGKKEYMKELERCFFSMTFGGETLSLASARATIRELKKKNYDHIWKLGVMLSDGINAAAKNAGLKVKFEGSAPRHKLSFDDKLYGDAAGMKDLFFQEMTLRKILFPNVIYIQFSHTEKHIEKTIAAAHEAFEIVAKNRYNIDAALKGARSTEAIKRDAR